MTSIKNIRSEATAFTDEPPDFRAELDASNMIREVIGWATPTKENHCKGLFICNEVAEF